jgi:plasmid maintenance system antidote protein VapI
MSALHEPPTSADLRSLAARCNVHWYVVASLIPLHPSRLSQLLNERIPMSPDIAMRIQHAIEEAARK